MGLRGIWLDQLCFSPDNDAEFATRREREIRWFRIHEVGEIGLAPLPGVFFPRPRARRRDCLQDVTHRGLGAEFLRENGQPIPPYSWTVAAGEADDHKRIVSQAD